MSTLDSLSSQFFILVTTTGARPNYLIVEGNSPHIQVIYSRYTRQLRPRRSGMATRPSHDALLTFAIRKQIGSIQRKNQLATEDHIKRGSTRRSPADHSLACPPMSLRSSSGKRETQQLRRSALSRDQFSVVKGHYDLLVPHATVSFCTLKHTHKCRGREHAQHHRQSSKHPRYGMLHSPKRRGNEPIHVATEVLQPDSHNALCVQTRPPIFGTSSSVA